MENLLTNIKTSLNRFVNDKVGLILQDIHEEALTSELLNYFKEEFTDFPFDINSNYNKRILDNELVNKQSEFLIETLPLKHWPKNWKDGQTHIKKEILPDFIFHNHKDAQSNYLIIELKKSTNKNNADRDWDYLKLREMTDRDLNYKWGVFIDLTTGAEFDKTKPYSLTVFSNGKIVYQE